MGYYNIYYTLHAPAPAELYQEVFLCAPVAARAETGLVGDITVSLPVRRFLGGGSDSRRSISSRGSSSVSYSVVA